MKTIKRLLWLVLVVLVIVAGVQIKGGYDKYQLALADRPLAEVIEELQDKENYTHNTGMSRKYIIRLSLQLKTGDFISTMDLIL